MSGILNMPYNDFNQLLKIVLYIKRGVSICKLALYQYVQQAFE